MSIAEVGGIGGTEDGVTSNGELAEPAECKQIADLGVDFLACGIGNIPACIPDWAPFLRASGRDQSDRRPALVLHGGTGIEDQIRSPWASRSTSTPMQFFAKGVREYIEAGKRSAGQGL